ncbi:hypothetical protein Hanom_Chr10g00953311 [Helianthus anomalus]
MLATFHFGQMFLSFCFVLFLYRSPPLISDLLVEPLPYRSGVTLFSFPARERERETKSG